VIKQGVAYRRPLTSKPQASYATSSLPPAHQFWGGNLSSKLRLGSGQSGSSANFQHRLTADESTSAGAGTVATGT